MRGRGILVLIVMAPMVLAGCDSASYVNTGKGEKPVDGMPGQVVYEVTAAYKKNPPACVAILPLTVPPGGESKTKLRIDQAETVRRAIYAHLSPQGKRDIELARIDFLLKKGKIKRTDLAAMGRTLNCDTVMEGEVTEYGSQFLGIYSRVAVGASLKLVRTRDGTVLWTGRHTAESQGGSVPLSPIGLAMGILEAAANVREEQVLRVIDDLARRLVSTIPDDRIAVLEDPAEPALPAPAVKAKPETLSSFLAGLKDKPTADRIKALQTALADKRFGEGATGTLYKEWIALAPNDATAMGQYGGYLMDSGDYDGALTEAKIAQNLAPANADYRFLKARALLKLNRLDEADTAVVEAIARDDKRALFYNALGFINSKRGELDRAVAAYRLAIQRDPTNGFAYYNMGVGYYNIGDFQNAADSFYGAGLAYIKAGRYGPAGKALNDLSGLTAQGVDVGSDVETLKQALAAIGKTKGK